MQETPVGISSVIDPVAEEARIRFGVEYLYPYQRLVIANVLDYASSFREASDHETISAAGETDNPSEHPDRLRQVVLLPTGYGKSLCFQLPALLLAGLTLAIYPLRSLMADQARRLRTRGIPCAVLQGGVPPEDRENALDGIRSGRVRIALANPEILRSGSVLSVLRSVRIDHAVVDEAHCVAEWGDSFRPAYRDLGDLVRYLDPGAVTAFTATASPGILRRTAEVLFGGEPWRLVAGDPDRPNLRYACAPTLSRAHTLERLVRSLPAPLLVFCSSRAGTQITAESLRRSLRTQEVRFYHAGMTKAERNAVETWFLPSRDGILTATCAFGLGIDKPDIRTVLHADPPPSAESYLQEAGRAGRDGKPSSAVLIVHPHDRESLGRETDPLRASRRKAVLDYAENPGRCRRETLLGLLGHDGASCSGCDVCLGNTVRRPEGYLEILAFTRANGGRYFVHEAARRLAGRGGACAGAGALIGWEHERVSEAIAYLTFRGEVRVPRKGLWKGRLLTSRRCVRKPPGGSALLRLHGLPRFFPFRGPGSPGIGNRSPPGRAEPIRFAACQPHKPEETEGQ